MNAIAAPGRIGGALRAPAGAVQVSFEFFPPADERMEATLWASIQRLAPLQPRFVSVTYGADGSTRERTHQVVARIVRETALTAAPHLTCIGTDRGPILEIARRYWDEGIRHIVALRGRCPPGQRRLPAPSGRVSLRDRPGPRAAHGRGLRDLGRRLPRGPPGGAERPVRSR